MGVDLRSSAELRNIMGSLENTGKPNKKNTPLWYSISWS